jgi:cyclic pyranopterin phosphate synthase
MSQAVPRYRLDGHKLMFHPHRLSKWLSGEKIFPLYLEISTSGACNHRCTFCLMDHMGYHSRYPDTSILKERLSECASLGVGSIMFGGEGEPLLNRDFAEIVAHSRSVGLDVALSTNGVLLTPALVSQIAPAMSWIKVSLNAGTPETYAAVHRTKPEDFYTVVANIESAARYIAEQNASCILGVQSVLLPENAAEMASLAAICRDVGVSYFVIKPHAQHYNSITRMYESLDYGPYLQLADQLEKISTDRFKVIFRMHTFNKLRRTERGYGRCLGLPFWSYIDSGGNVWGCSDYLGDERFLYGNIHQESFRDIWLGEQRQRSLDFVARELDPEKCSLNCRMDEINLYLWELTHPAAHVNFI